MKAMEGIRQVAERPLAPVYVVVGVADYWIDAFVRAMVRRAHDEYGAVETVRLGRGSPLEWRQLVEAWQTPNLWGSAQVFWAESLPTSAPTKFDGQWFQPSPGRHLVVQEAKRGAVSRAFSEAVLIEAEPPPANLWTRWIALLGKSRDLSLSEDAISALAQLIPHDGYHLEQELSKMQILQGRVKGWNGAAVRAWVLAESGEESVWAVTDALLAKDAKMLYPALQNALDQGKAPVMLLALMARQLASIRRAQRASTEAAFQAAEGLPSFVARKIYRGAKKWRESELMQAILWAGELDRWFKDSLGEPTVALVQFALALVSG